MEKVSFIVPVYNTAPYLRECVDCLLNQTHSDIEVILVDDESDDESYAICQEYVRRDHRVKAVQQEHAGPAAARNLGLSKVTGQWIAMVDSDDLVDRQFAEVLLQVAKDTDTDIVSCNSMRDMRLNNYSRLLPVKMFSPNEAIGLTLYQQRLNCSVWGKLYRREVWGDVKFTRGILYEDLDVFSRVCERANRIALLPMPMYHYRYTPGSIINKFTPKRLDVLKVVDGLVERYSHDKELSKAARDRKFAANFNMFILCHANAGAVNAGAENNCWQQVKNLRCEVLLNGKARLKNRFGALLSYLGKNVTMAISKILY